MWPWEGHLNVNVPGSPCIKLTNSIDTQNYCKNEALVKVPGREEALLHIQPNAYSIRHRMLSFAFTHSESLNIFQSLYF